MKECVSSIWDKLKTTVTTDLEKGNESKIKMSLATMINNFGKNFQENPVMIAKINDFVKIYLLGILIRNKKNPLGI